MWYGMMRLTNSASLTIDLSIYILLYNSFILIHSLSLPFSSQEPLIHLNITRGYHRPKMSRRVTNVNISEKRPVRIPSAIVPLNQRQRWELLSSANPVATENKSSVGFVPPDLIYLQADRAMPR